MKTALIFGISGQDGSYLASLLLAKNYKVYGVSRDLEVTDFSNLHRLEIYNKVEIISATASDLNSTIQALNRSKPDEIYNLSGQTSVSLSFDQPIETIESIITGTQNLLDGIRFFNSKIRFFNACSTDCFGNTGAHIADELTGFHPTSPYAIAKVAAYWQVVNYREAYNIFACSGIMSNHESPLRPQRFVTQKIVSAACRIYSGADETLRLGNLDIIRDWGWAPDYVEAMWLMLQHSYADDFIIATGKSHLLKIFVEKVFAYLELDYAQHVEVGSQQKRPSDFTVSKVTAEKARSSLGWSASEDLDHIVAKLVDAKLGR